MGFLKNVFGSRKDNQGSESERASTMQAGLSRFYQTTFDQCGIKLGDSEQSGLNSFARQVAEAGLDAERFAEVIGASLKRTWIHQCLAIIEYQRNCLLVLDKGLSPFDGATGSWLGSSAIENGIRQMIVAAGGITGVAPQVRRLFDECHVKDMLVSIGAKRVHRGGRA